MNFILSNKYWIYLGIFLSFFIVLVLPFSGYILILLALLSLLYYFGEKFIVMVSIVVFIVYTRKEFSDSRDIVTWCTFGFIFIYFLLKNGFNLKNYPRVPKKTMFIVLSLFLATSFSTLFQPFTLSNLTPLLKTIVFFCYCYYIYSFIKGEKEIKIIIYSLFVVQVIIASTMLRDLYNEGFSFVLADGGLARFTGVVEGPNVVGLITCISCNFLIVLFFSKKFESTRKKWLLNYLIFNNSIVMFFSDSRAAGIAIILGAAIILLVFNKKAFWISFTVLVSVIGILFLIPPIQSFLMLFIRPQGFSLREPLWNSGIEMFYAHPLIGVGPEKFPSYFFSHLSSMALGAFNQMGSLINGVPSPHNFFLLMSSENGLPGLFAGISLFIIYFYMTFKLISWKTRLEREDYLIAISLLAVGVGAFFRSFFEISGIFHYGFLSNDLPFWICIIILSFLFKKYSPLKLKSV